MTREEETIEAREALESIDIEDLAVKAVALLSDAIGAQQLAMTTLKLMTEKEIKEDAVTEVLQHTIETAMLSINANHLMILHAKIGRGVMQKLDQLTECQHRIAVASENRNTIEEARLHQENMRHG